MDTILRRRVSQQAQRDTKPELAVRQALRRLGHSYRTHVGSLPGSPDIANRAREWAIFVHGCYWHHHVGCKRATIPKRNREWWIEKFQRNAERDARKARDLRDLGLDVLVVWECQTSAEAPLEGLLNAWFEARSENRWQATRGSLNVPSFLVTRDLRS